MQKGFFMVSRIFSDHKKAELIIVKERTLLKFSKIMGRLQEDVVTKF